VYGLENEGLGYRWFQTQSSNRVSGVYFQSTLNAGRPILPTNDLDYTDEVTNIYKEGGEGCDFKDSKKPEKLIEWLLKITTDVNDTVVDLFGGSGTTLAVCLKNKRFCTTVEKHVEPYNIIKTRVENLKKEFPELKSKCIEFLDL
jgi:DNA modification methylase